MPPRATKKTVPPRSVSSAASARRAGKAAPAGRAKRKAKAKSPAAKPKPKPTGKTAARKPAKTAARKPAKTAARRPARRTTRQTEVPAREPAAPRTRTRSTAAEAVTPRTGAARRPRSRPAAAAVRATEPAEPVAAPVAPLERFALPETYGKTRVRVLMQSPGRLFVHWDLSPGVVEELKAQFGQRAASLARLAIRVTTPGAARPLLVLLPRGARSWYVDVPGQRHEYRAEIGLMLPSGEFRPVAASNVVRMPRTSPSPTPASRRVAFQAGEAPPAGSSLETPPDEPSGEEALLEVAEHDEEALGEATGASGATGAPGGSSEMSGRGRPRRARGAPALAGGASDLADTGSSSDLRPRRKPG